MLSEAAVNGIAFTQDHVWVITNDPLVILDKSSFQVRKIISDTDSYSSILNVVDTVWLRGDMGTEIRDAKVSSSNFLFIKF